MTTSIQSPDSWQMSDRERANLQKVTLYNSVQSLSEIWPLAAKHYNQTIALHDPHAKPEVKFTYAELNEQIQKFAAGLQSLGVVPTENDTSIPPRVALFADNSPRWMIADQGIIAAGAADVVRSGTADIEELAYILQHSGSVSLVVENLALLKKLSDRLQDLPIHLIILLSEEDPNPEESLPVVKFSQVIATGEDRPLKPTKQNLETLATLLYTSGTTGKPKGVMLTHGNLLYQINVLGALIQPNPGECTLNILPTWHTFGRTGEYFFLSQGCTQIYTNKRSLKKDFQQYKPHYVTSVPRVWELIYEGVQKQLREQPANKQKLAQFFLGVSQRYIEARRVSQGLVLQLDPPSQSQKLLATLQSWVLLPLHRLGEKIIYQKIRQATGGRLKFAISGGGSLAMHLENFFEIVGIGLLVGYGLTETSPVLTVRHHWNNLRGSAGKPIPATEIKVVDPETNKTLTVGNKGVVWARGPQIMNGYYQNPEATEKVIDSEGWFNTGDIGWITPENDLVLTGRAKDTIVLTNGENIEPQPIEDACARSQYIDQIMLVGQDQKFLGALVVPNIEAVEQWAIQLNPSESQPQIDWESQTIQELFRQELNREVKNRPGYRPDDRIGPFRLILEPFTVENGMTTQTMKIKRPIVTDHYRDMINKMFD
ncbi:long-chain fatty acid--CoA ligase [Okeania sp. SIO1I7]|uniref:long-chain fatty acid--CoA ligase n=1 Tax=Okeania sp. SIO1I7 TaxID=2607772 RepID=UPI0013F9A6F3|nr:long-chain fatty acid--CoA ligase [Okeania sp. SIO1I7]NET26762.1 long-chain fatty acid--CoA ligase [Okeania sp. SIO1I7]